MCVCVCAQQIETCRHIVAAISTFLIQETLVGLNIFYSKEMDWVWHKTRHNPVQGDTCCYYLRFTFTFPPLLKVINPY